MEYHENKLREQHAETLKKMTDANELQRLKDRASRLKEWLNNPVNRMRITYEVVAADYRKTLAAIEAEEAEMTMFNLNLKS